MKNKMAVEWLVEELNQKIDFIPMDKWDEIRDIVQQAKAMEKEQIINAYNHGTFFLRGEDYFKKHFEDESGI